MFLPEYFGWTLREEAEAALASFSHLERSKDAVLIPYNGQEGWMGPADPPTPGCLWGVSSADGEYMLDPEDGWVMVA